jgi:predicted RNA-binding protein
MRFWIGVASQEHVKLGVAGNFCQLCHGKAQSLKRMSVGDWMIYYSSKEKFGEATACQRFTAIGQVVGEDVYAREMISGETTSGFAPYRRDIHFRKSTEVDIRPLIERLSFIKNKNRWGYAFRFGHLEIPQADFALIASRMLGRDPTAVDVPQARRRTIVQQSFIAAVV